MKEEQQMKKRFSVYVMVFAAITFLIAACGRDHGDDAVPVDLTATSTVTVTADKRIALANGSENITLTALVTNVSGSALAGKTISFAITSGTGTLQNAGATTSASGNATVQVNRGPISPLTKEDVIVTATADGISGSKTVRFINLPASAAIEVALTKTVTDLAILTFDIVSAPTQTPPIFLQLAAIGAADTPPFINGVTTQTFQLAAFTFSLMTSENPGITTTPNSPIVGLTYNIDSTIQELPIFSVGPNNIRADDSGGFPILPTLNQADISATTVFDTEL
jgi:hypothetical protein